MPRAELEGTLLGSGALKKEVEAVSWGIHLLFLLSPVSPHLCVSGLLELEEASCSLVLHLQQGGRACTSQTGIFGSPPPHSSKALTGHSMRKRLQSPEAFGMV